VTSVVVPHDHRAVLARALPLLLAGLLVATSIAYPLTSGADRARVTWIIVVLGATLTVTHAALSRGGSAAARVLLLTTGTSIGFEAVGLATGFPYGSYSYSAALGPTLLGVPFPVPLAWLMMAWPSWLLAELLTRRVRPHLHSVVRIGVAAAVFAGWDVVLDPQLVQAGYWTWAHPHPGLPGIATVPLTNLAGWLLAGLVLMTALDVSLSPSSVTDDPRVDATAPLLALAWMTVGGALAEAGWLGLPGAAAWGVGLAVPVGTALVVRRIRR
jgi:putative membrane protein